ncbi:MAG: M20/M25/M40 family metallo-hydrolase [Clostridia bacterium]|nr:M20/M25/M40 family metallo-hydrolase [Clostridia bacterium]
MKKSVKITAGAAAAAALGATIVRAASLKDDAREVAPLPEEHIVLERYKRNLSDAIKIKTISSRDHSKVDWSQFDAFHAFLEARYPLFHKTLSKEVVSKASLMYFWQGSDPSLDPIAMLAHQDVVPITPGTEQDWSYDPFGGVEAEGYIWGRGALDMKNHLIAVMESIEALLEDGYQPQRSVYVLLGHNEETMEHQESGAAYMCRTLAERGVHLEAVLDEGGANLPVSVPGLIDVDIVGVGIAEKGQVDYEISVRGKGGHSSQPPKHTALGQLANVIRDLENHQYKASITPLFEDLFVRAAKKAKLPVKLLVSNLPVLKPVLARALTTIPPAACMVRTTTAVTMAQGSPAPNVLPQKATVNANFRMMPGESVADVERHIRKVVRNKDIEIKLIKGKEPSKISTTDSKAFKAIEDISAATDKKNVVVPYLVMGGTDSYLYEPICENIYRYSPFKLTPKLLTATHGTNEKIPVDCMADAVIFFKRYIKEMTK